MRRLPLLLLTLLALAGCDDQPSTQAIPEISDANCTLEVINQIQDRTARAEFAGQCSRRSGAIQPTEQPKNWLELNSSQG
ncbi:entry exclusion lipoprotein TrbK [Pseudomonas sp. GD03721]|uniref:entry exclusion lipoprotein TrbK n=1 Tax=Pseudomonas aeruginosa group TaxID=136841 RepID=UPI00071B943F|nr:MULTISPECIES: entry exclusion lipoprotein TrbK [Pseudomonas]KSR41473.1 entry exclusion lipoprotein TrbK [Pseudomonas aeruginosa]MDH1442955.1 entry exclusion lipoprotein TrbK [Pseudomonas sp. GD03722]MDV5859869.1 entry exclusion lipoprotein TrbK [Pseudomonas mendocina]RPV15473.1 entry exclusion lipoprotein TrbK [Pseudomonas aeruginosa]WGG02231.1 entry exclusion lipoprotein TrbK [Pseudomonas sp. GD03721]